MTIDIQIGDMIKVERYVFLYKYSEEHIGILIKNDFNSDIHNHIIDEIRNGSNYFHQIKFKLELIGIYNSFYVFKCKDYFVALKDSGLKSRIYNDKIIVDMKHRRLNNINRILS